MSSEKKVERSHRLVRTDPVGISSQLREELKMGGVSGVAIDIEGRTILVERLASVQQQLDLHNEAQEAQTIVDPVEYALENLSEMNVQGFTLREAMFEVADAAIGGGGAIVSWVCGDPQRVAKMLDRQMPRLQSHPLFILQAALRHSPRLSETDVVACIGPSLDDPAEVVAGILFRLEDITAPRGESHEHHPVSANRELPGPEAGRGSATQARPSGPGRSRPLWAGPAPGR